MTLEASESLRDRKRQELSVLFGRYQALQTEMKEMEKELLSLDEHIDELQSSMDDLEESVQKLEVVSCLASLE